MGRTDYRDPTTVMQTDTPQKHPQELEEVVVDGADGSAERAPAQHVRVLIVDDDIGVSNTLRRVLLDRGFEVQIAENADQALQHLAQGRIEVMLLDVVMPNVSGMELLQIAKQRHSDVEVVMMTGHGDIDTAVRAVKHGAYDFLTKPFGSIDTVVMSVGKAAQHKRLIDRMKLLEKQLEVYGQFEDMVGNSPAMQNVYRLARGVATTNASVLIQGESGTGKELVARAIHKHSARSEKAFVAVNCSAIPVDLVESELFGHVRGAFTGATSTRNGLFETADHGTLFLDEIADLPVPAQVKLLRALQEGEIKPVGSDVTRTVDVRVIAATNADLRKRVDDGKFREDLFYRLNVIAIHLPPLRKRQEDIPLLAYHFMNKFVLRNGRDIKTISPEAMNLLRDHRWKGNVRELENAIEHAVVLARGDSILPGDLPFAHHQTEDHLGEAGALVAGLSGFSLPPDIVNQPFTEARKRVLQLFETAYVDAILKRTHGNISEAARKSGIDRSNFRRVLKKNQGAKVDPGDPRGWSDGPEQNKGS